MREPVAHSWPVADKSLTPRMRSLSITRKGCPTHLALWYRGWRGSTRTLGPGGFARRVLVTATVARNAQVERLEVVFSTQTHRRVADFGPRFGLPPFAILAQSPVRCGHDCLLFWGNFSGTAALSLPLPSFARLTITTTGATTVPHIPVGRKSMYASSLPPMALRQKILFALAERGQGEAQ
jgi:hypothetical protein